MIRAGEIVPGRHISQGDPSIFFGCFCFVGNKAELSFNLPLGIAYEERCLLDFLGPFFCGCLCPPGCCFFDFFSLGEAGSLRPGEVPRFGDLLGVGGRLAFGCFFPLPVSLFFPFCLSFFLSCS
jgi:hypothetical protein